MEEEAARLGRNFSWVAVEVAKRALSPGEVSPGAEQIGCDGAAPAGGGDVAADVPVSGDGAPVLERDVPVAGEGDRAVVSPADPAGEGKPMPPGLARFMGAAKRLPGARG